VHISQQVLHLLWSQTVAEGWHLGSSAQDHLAGALVVGRRAAGQFFLLEYSHQRGTVPATGDIGFMTTQAVSVIESAAARLLRVESEFGVAFVGRTGLASGEGERQKNLRQDFPQSWQTIIMGTSAPVCKLPRECAMPVFLKRAYEKPSAADGTRVLVDRLWPRGLKRDSAALDAWLKDVAPSDDLRRWIHARPELWPAFRKKYLAELAAPAASKALQQLYELAGRRRQLTLVFASRNLEQNNAVVLKQLLEGMRKPPSTSGPNSAAATSARAARARTPRRR